MSEQNEFECELLEISKGLTGGYHFLINNAGKAIAFITLLVASVLIFADIGLADLGSAGFTTTLAAMLIASYIIYFSLEDSGERLGERSQEYNEALSKYKAARSKIGAHNIAALRAFCIKYSREELIYRREEFVTEAGYTPEEYAAYKHGEAASLRERYIFSRASKMTAVKLTPAVLLSGGSFSSASELENPERKKLIHSFLSLIPSSICMIFTVSVILTARGDLTPSVIIDGLIKLSTLPLIGFRGYTAGYSFIKDKKSVWVETKARLLEAFIDEGKKLTEQA